MRKRLCLIAQPYSYTHAKDMVLSPAHNPILLMMVDYLSMDFRRDHNHQFTRKYTSAFAFSLRRSTGPMPTIFCLPLYRPCIQVCNCDALNSLQIQSGADMVTYMSRALLLTHYTHFPDRHQLINNIGEIMHHLLVLLCLTLILHVSSSCNSDQYVGDDGLGNTTCQPCLSPCLTCVGGSRGYCTTCSGLTFTRYRSQNYGGCLNTSCLNGSYDGAQCLTCHPYCSVCFGNGSNSQCLACNPKYYLSSQFSCTPCYSPCVECVGSNSSSCITCVDGYYFTPSNSDYGSCSACHYSCQSCNGTSLNCTSCNASYSRIQNHSSCVCAPFKMDDGSSSNCTTLVCPSNSGESVNSSGYCSVVCGDGLVGAGELCDDHNLENLDGCSSNCTIQDYFRCEDGSTSSASNCKYESPINISIISITKDPYSNSITYVLLSNTTAPFMQSINYSSVIQFGFSYFNPTYTYSNGIITFQVDYDQSLNLNSESYTLSVNFSHSSSMLDDLVATYSATKSPYVLRSSNNLAINGYPPDVYEKIEGVRKFTQAVVFAGLVIFGIGLIRGKIIGLQLIGTLQLTYFGLVFVKFSDPLFYPVMELIYSNGYNVQLQNSYPQDFPSELQSMGVHQQFIQNINVMLGVSAILLIVSMILLIAATFDISNARYKCLEQNRKTIFGELFFSSLIFSSLQASFSIGVMVKYFPDAGMMLYSSIAAAGFYLSGLVVALIFYKIKKDDYFGEFQMFFKGSKLYPFYFTLHIAQRIVIGVLLGTFGSNYISGIVAVVIILSHCVFVGICMPYALKVQNIRSIVVMLCGVINLGICIYVGKRGPSSDGGGFNVYSPYAILGLLGFCCLLSLARIIVEIVRIAKIHLDMISGVQSGKVVQEKQEDIFQKQLKRRLQSGKKPAIDLSKMIKSKIKKKRPMRRIIIQPFTTEVEKTGEMLLQRIANFDKYESEWLRREQTSSGLQQMEMQDLGVRHLQAEAGRPAGDVEHR